MVGCIVCSGLQFAALSMPGACTALSLMAAANVIVLFFSRCYLLLVLVLLFWMCLLFMFWLDDMICLVYSDVHSILRHMQCTSVGSKRPACGAELTLVRIIIHCSHYCCCSNASNKHNSVNIHAVVWAAACNLPTMQYLVHTQHQA